MSASTCYCSFCGNGNNEVDSMVAGPTVFICNSCVELCIEVMSEMRPNIAERFFETASKMVDIEKLKSDVEKRTFRFAAKALKDVGLDAIDVERLLKPEARSSLEEIFDGAVLPKKPTAFLPTRIEYKFAAKALLEACVSKKFDDAGIVEKVLREPKKTGARRAKSEPAQS